MIPAARYLWLLALGLLVALFLVLAVGEAAAHGEVSGRLARML